LWIARRHRKARVHGSTAVSLIKKGKFRAAAKKLIAAFQAWPLLVIDLHGFFLALKELTNREQNEPAVPELWPEWDD